MCSVLFLTPVGGCEHGADRDVFWAKTRGNTDGSLQCPADSLRTTLTRCAPTVSCQWWTTFGKETDMRRALKRVRDVTGIVTVENERLLERERHLEGQQERQVQREDGNESRARWSYVQSSEEGCGCFVSSYRLRVICLPQLYHPAVTHCYAPLCPGILAHSSLCPPLSACVCVYSTFVSPCGWRLLAWKWASSGYVCSVSQYESLSVPFPSISETVEHHFRQPPT